ncbi:MAG: SpoIIE family protein phosphatase [Desulfobacterales bacterium]|nr:SpoIIE family protein phosphatase [Desulfobacterales bacterium]
MLRSFRGTLMLIILLSAVVPVTLLAAILVKEIYTLTSNGAYNELNLLVKSVASDINHKLDLATSRILDIGANPDVVLATAKSPFGIRTSASYRAVEFMQQFIADTPLVSAIYLLGGDGNVIEAVPESMASIAPAPIKTDIKALLARKFEYGEPPFFFVEFKGRRFLERNIKATAGPADVSADRVQSPYGLALLVPLIDAAGENRGALAAIIPVAGLADFAAGNAGGSVSIDILKGRDTMLAGDRVADSLPRAREISSETPLLIGDSGNNQRLEYLLRVAEPHAVRFAAVNRTIMTLVAFLVAGGIVLLIISYAVARWLASPIQSLGRIVGSYAEGNYEAPQQRVRFTEFRQVTDVLAGMGDKIMAQISALKNLNETLEEKVIEKTAQLQENFDELDLANKKILESIRYAEKIQQSLLPNTVEMCRYLDNFIIWQPRDIVGGDIFMFERFANGYLVAVMDCTGHGVPGAFVTMIVGSTCKTILKENDPADPAGLLGVLNTVVKNSLNQGEADSLSSDDGLDAGICFVNTENRTLTFAGAKIPLWYIVDSEIHEIRGDKQSLGYIRSDPDFRFTNHRISLETGAVYYLGTDGVTDQVGGQRRLPFGKRRLFDVLLRNWQLPLNRQRELLLTAFTEYQNDEDRRDDVSFIGLAPLRNGQ